MNFLILKYFKTVATELNITHAAQKLYISQQALSAHMRNLESELGVKLFNRTPRLSLTDAGRCLLEATEGYDRLTNILNDKLNDIRNHERGELRIGLSFTRGQFILPLVLPPYAQAHPQVHINIYEEPSFSLMERLLHNEIDFWVTAENPDIEGIHKEPLFKESFYIVIPNKILDSIYGEKAASVIIKKFESDFELEDIIQCPFVLLNPGNRSRDLFDNALRARKLTPNIILETDNSQTAFALAQKEMAITVYSDMFLRNYSGKLNPRVKIIPLGKYIPSDILHVYYTEECRSSGYKQSFLKSLHKAFS